MKVTKWLSITVMGFAIMACSKSKPTPEKQDFATQSQTVTKVEQQAPAAPEPETVVVNGKEIQLTRGVTTRAEIIEMLGEADIDIETSLRYHWREGRRLYECIFYMNNDIFTEASNSSMKY